MVEQLQAERQTTQKVKLSKEREIDHFRFLLMNDQQKAAETQVKSEHGSDRTVEDVVVEGQQLVDKCDARVEAIDLEITCLLWEEIYPGAPTLNAYDQREHQEATERIVPLDFDHTEALISLLWEEIGSHFADAGFSENAEILVAMQERLGLGGICQLVVALRQQEAEPLRQLCDLITHQERRVSPDCYNRMTVRRTAQGALVIMIDQPGNLDYLPPLVLPGNGRHLNQRRPLGARQREARGRPVRRRGSRRVTSRSAGGGDDPDPEPAPCKGISEWRERTMWDVAMTGVGWTIGGAAMGQEGALIGAIVGYLWSRHRWQ